MVLIHVITYSAFDSHKIVVVYENIHVSQIAPEVISEICFKFLGTCPQPRGIVFFLNNVFCDAHSFPFHLVFFNCIPNLAELEKVFGLCGINPTTPQNLPTPLCITANGISFYRDRFIVGVRILTYNS